jgi:hypothetical protein
MVIVTGPQPGEAAVSVRAGLGLGAGLCVFIHDTISRATHVNSTTAFLTDVVVIAPPIVEVDWLFRACPEAGVGPSFV